MLGARPQAMLDASSRPRDAAAPHPRATLRDIGISRLASSLVAHDAHGIASLLPKPDDEMTMSQTHAISQTGS